jgi:protein gp37
MRTGIQWTDVVWNPVTGCTKVSAGCAHCYAETFAGRQMGGWKGRAFTDVRCHPERLDAPLRGRTPRRVFVNSMSDLFHPDVPDQFIIDVFGVMALAHWHTFQVLTKRPERMCALLGAGDHGILRQFMLLQQNGGTSTRNVFRALDLKRRDNVEWRWPLPNVWLGVSVENQETANARIPLLLQTPAARRFVSAEPLLGPIDLMRIDTTSDTDPGYSALELRDDDEGDLVETLDWVIVGGESGPHARPCDVAWIRSIAEQCRAAAVPCFVKQLGAHVRDRNDAGFEGDKLGGWPMVTEYEWLDGFRQNFQGDPVRVCLKHRKGGDPEEWPEDLRVREFPAIAARS